MILACEDSLPIALHRHAAEMDDAVDAGDSALDRGEVAEIGGDEALALPEIGERRPVGKKQLAIGAAQQYAQALADTAGSTGDEHALHVRAPDISQGETMDRNAGSVKGGIRPPNPGRLDCLTPNNQAVQEHRRPHVRQPPPHPRRLG